MPIKRDAAQQAKLDAAFKQIREMSQLDLPKLGTIRIPDSTTVLRYAEIDYDLASRLDGPRIREIKDRFRYQQTDILLDQAADLLDRALKSRGEYDELRDVGFRANLEVAEFERLDQIHLDEAEAGFYNLVAAETASDWQAEITVGAAARSAHKEIEKRWQGLDDSRNGRRGEAGLVARLDASPLHPHDFGYAQYDEAGNPSVKGNNKIDLAFSAAAKIADRAVDDRRDELITEKGITLGTAEAAETRAAAKETRKGYEAKAGGDTGFSMNRTLVRRSVNEARVIEMGRPGGALNYLDRLDSLFLHLKGDIESAAGRLVAAAKGLKYIFGWTEPLPAPLLLLAAGFRPHEPEPERRLVDECVQWTRRAIDFLVRFRSLDQSYVLPISLRSRMKNGKIPIGAKFDFAIPESYFRDGKNFDQRHVRLRGVSAFTLESDKTAGLWDVILWAPKNGLCRFHPWYAPQQEERDGSIKKDQQSGDFFAKLDQSDVPPCRLATVERRFAQREPMVAGSISWLNVSPIGYDEQDDLWKVLIAPVPGSGAKPDDLGDVFLQLHVAVQAV